MDGVLNLNLRRKIKMEKEKTRKQLKEDLIRLIKDSKILDYKISHQGNETIIKFKEGKMKDFKQEDWY